MPRLTQAPWPAALPSRRTWLAGMLASGAAWLGGCSGNSNLFSSSPPPQSTAAPPGATLGAGRRQGRPDPAAVGQRQCRPRRPVDEERRRHGARRIQRAQHPAPGQGRRRHHRGGPAGRPAGARRRRRNHPRAAVRAIGQRRRAGGARPQRAGHRVFDRRQCRQPRRLSVELPAGIRRRPHRPARHFDRQAFVRRADSGQCLRLGGRGRIQAGGRAPRRADRGAGALSARPGRDGGAGQERRAGRGPRRFDLHSRRRRRRAERGQGAGRERREHQAHPASRHRPVGRSAHLLRSRARRRLVRRARRRRASAISPAVTAPASARIRCAPRRWPTTPSR